MSTNSVDSISEDAFQYKIGARVIRKLAFCDYYQQLDDSTVPNPTNLISTTFRKAFANIVGTVTEFHSNGQVTVFWDDGSESEYRNDEGSDLRIVDNSTAGVSFWYCKCSECEFIVEGIIWACIDCGRYICSSCYHGDKHDLEHRFARTVNPHSTSELVEPRSGSNKIVLQGIFENSEVVRIDESSEDESEDDIFPIGEVVKYEFAKNIVHVKWDDEKEESYSLGNSGKVLLKATSLSNGPYVYHEHLPLFNETEFEKLRRRILEYDDEDPFAYALHHAVLCENLNIIEYLKNCGANLDACDCLDQTPLYIAVCLGHRDIVEKLMEWGCDPQKENIIEDSSLLFAIRNMEEEIFELLFHPNLTIDTFKKIIISSIRHHNSYSLKMILNHFPDTSSLNKIYLKGTPLHYAILHNNYEACEMLIQSGKIDLNIRSSILKATALHMASKERNMNIFKLLISSNCDVNIADKDGDTALHYIIRKHERLARELSFNTEKKVEESKILEEMAIMLVSNGAKLEQSNNEQQTPIDLTKDSSFVEKLVLASKEYSIQQYQRELEKTKQLLQSFEEKFTCPVCKDQNKNIMYQCGHCVCDDCSERLDQCPVCRGEILEKKQIF